MDHRSTIERLFEAEGLSEAQFTAGDRWLGAWQVLNLQPRRRRADRGGVEAVGCRVDGGEPWRAAADQAVAKVAARRIYDQGRAALGDRLALVEAVVIHDRSVAAVGDQLGMHQRTAYRQLRQGLDLLASAFGID